MNIKILSDSTCDLPQEMLERYDITLFPLVVVKNDVPYRDNVTITPAEIFDHVANGGALCSTTAGSVGEYQDLFAQYADKYDGVVHINISAGFSSCYQNACLAAEEFDNVIVIDSRNLSTGQGLVVIKAAQYAKECKDLQELKEKVEAVIPKVEASFVLNRLEYMVKGGRCSSAKALGANLLNLKPCIDVRDGKMGVGKKYRGNYTKCLTSYVKDRLSGRDDIDRDLLFITYTPVSDEDLAAVKAAVAEFGGEFGEICVCTAGCTVSCHCGPGTLGVLFIRK